MAGNTFAISLGSNVIVSSTDTTAVPTAVDLANYFPVGKRSVKFVVTGVNNSTLAVGATIYLEECESTATASFSTMKIAGSTSSAYYVMSTAATTAYASTIFEVNCVVNYRYIRARSYVTTTSTGPATTVVTVVAIPRVRAA